MRIVKKCLIVIGIILIIACVCNFYGIGFKVSKNHQFIEVSLPVDVFSLDEFRQVGIWVLPLTNPKETVQVSLQLRRDYRTCYWGNDTELWIDGDVGIVCYQYEKGEWKEYPVVDVDKGKILCEGEGKSKVINLESAPAKIVKRLLSHFDGMEEPAVVVSNIAVTPYSVYENDLLCEYFKSELEDAEDIKNVYDTFFSAEYFTYDFNNDGIEDYLVSLSGSGWNGSLGNQVAIVCADEDGSLTEVFSATVRFAENGENGGYSSVTVLNELVDGFYSFRFEGYDKIWKYNSLNGRYE